LDTLSAIIIQMVTRRYKEYLRSDAWQKKRLAVFNKYGKRCYACRTAVGPIQVHHLDYSRFGRESLDDLMPLCIPCHREVTRIYKRNRRIGLRRVTMDFVKRKRTR
jgi:5-methylcytosine-specific restriction endonuclease McrA